MRRWRSSARSTATGVPVRLLCSIPRGVDAELGSQALGARAEIALCGISEAEASPLFDGLKLELARIESLFSLYRTDSALAQLNRDQILRNPDPSMLHLLSEARAVFTATEGAFDPTVQPLFDLHAGAFAEGRSVGADEVQHVRRRVGFQHVPLSPQSIRFQRGGMALNLNGIAQGYATDRLAFFLKGAGLRHILVNAGEIRALGDGRGRDGVYRSPAAGPSH